MPEHMQVVLGTHETMAFRPTDFPRLLQCKRSAVDSCARLNARAATYPLFRTALPPVRLCAHIARRSAAGDHLSLVA